MARSFRVLDRGPLCEPCADKAVVAEKGVKHPPGWVIRYVDSTICARCETDWGNVELQPIGGGYFCAQCSAIVRDFPIPQWVKISLAATLVLVLIGTVHNLRYVQAVRNANAATRSMTKGDIDDADTRITAAAKLVPESTEIVHFSSFIHGVALLKHDKSKEALQAIEGAKDELGETPMYQQAHIAAMLGVSFDAHDYDAFLQQALDLHKQDENSAYALAAVSSAYACKYALTGDEKFRALSQDFLARAQRAPEGKQMGDYVERIEHRLRTREIITQAEYQRRFGAKKEAR